MRQAVLRVLTALLTFGSGVAAVSSWRHLNRPAAAKSYKYFSGPPCGRGVVSAITPAGAPLSITVTESTCDRPQTASVHFVVRNVSGKPITSYKVYSVMTYNRLRDDGSSVTTTGLVLQPGQEEDGFLGGGVITGAGGIKAGQLRSYQVVVDSVTFADGSGWHRPAQLH